MDQASKPLRTTNNGGTGDFYFPAEFGTSVESVLSDWTTMCRGASVPDHEVFNHALGAHVRERLYEE